LTNAVSTVLRLEILLRVPVRIVQNHCISGRKVNALATSTRAQEEDLEFWIGIERLDLLSSVTLADGAVNPATIPGAELGGPVLKDIQLRFELGEDENFMFLLEKAGDQTIQEQHFA
jgi:hypothetical protein